LRREVFENVTLFARNYFMSDNFYGTNGNNSIDRRLRRTLVLW